MTRTRCLFICETWILTVLRDSLSSLPSSIGGATVVMAERHYHRSSKETVVKTRRWRAGEGGRRADGTVRRGTLESEGVTKDAQPTPLRNSRATAAIYGSSLRHRPSAERDGSRGRMSGRDP